jgi:hypothetical protein
MIVNNELERMWKEGSWPNSRYCLAIYLEGLRTPRNSSVRIAVVPAYILVETNQNIKQKITAVAN